MQLEFRLREAEAAELAADFADRLVDVTGIKPVVDALLVGGVAVILAGMVGVALAGDATLAIVATGRGRAVVGSEDAGGADQMAMAEAAMRMEKVAVMGAFPRSFFVASGRCGVSSRHA